MCVDRRYDKDSARDIHQFRLESDKVPLTFTALVNKATLHSTSSSCSPPGHSHSSPSLLPASAATEKQTMDDATDRSPASRQPLQGPRPLRLAVSKDSHNIHKPAAVTPQRPRRPSVIKFDAKPAGGLNALDQRLNGPVSAAAAAGAAAPVYTMGLEGASSASAALSPAAKLAANETAVRPLPRPTESSRRRCCHQLRAPGSGSHRRRCRCSTRAASPT